MLTIEKIRDDAVKEAKWEEYKARKEPDVVCIDFESDGIEPRPHYPPKPIGVSIKYPGKKAHSAWSLRKVTSARSSVSSTSCSRD